MNAADLTFRRKERKYIILEHTFDEIIGEIEEHIPVYHFEDKPGLADMETIYMDSEDFLLYNEYLNRRNFRFKIRMRRYGYEGVFEPYFLVEMKVQYNSFTTKKRFVLPAELYDAFIRGEDIRQAVKEANESSVGAQKTYRLIHKLIKINGLVPVLRTSYTRIAFQKKSKRVRITVDKGITHNKLLGNPKTESLDAIVLESKIMGKSPKWHKKLVNQLSLLRQQRFSKFATGINSLYFPKRGKYYFFNDEETAVNDMPQPITESFELLKTALKLEQ
jgi:SPX domain protein involved in polyphosphate accumulation